MNQPLNLRPSARPRDPEALQPSQLPPSDWTATDKAVPRLVRGIQRPYNRTNSRHPIEPQKTKLCSE